MSVFCIATVLKLVVNCFTFSPEGVPPGSANRQMNDSTATMYGDHVYMQPGMGNFGRQRAQSAKRSNSSGHSGRAGGRALVRAATAGVQRAPRPQSTSRRPSTGAFGTAWIRRDTADSDSDYDATLSTVSDSGSEISGADGNKQTTVTWQGTAARANRRRPRAPARQYDFLRKGGKSVEEQLMAKSCARQQQVMQMKMAINEERRRALDARLKNFWTHYPLEPWYAQ